MDGVAKETGSAVSCPPCQTQSVITPHNSIQKYKYNLRVQTFVISNTQHLHHNKLIKTSTAVVYKLA